MKSTEQNTRISNYKQINKKKNQRQLCLCACIYSWSRKCFD